MLPVARCVPPPSVIGDDKNKTGPIRNKTGNIFPKNRFVTNTGRNLECILNHERYRAGIYAKTPNGAAQIECQIFKKWHDVKVGHEFYSGREF